eukprot:TRINITY_DN5975_c0_g2_i1.p1 TRINITY_DN5975_c0_g2~~TRINITY_DN5975_c0_g2_i1.p1  ORF type:complete len:211 (-),score=62.94 TRINITY_DN5975_c0_g2_i1:195-827(-)
MDDADEPADQTNLTDGFDFQLKKNPVAVVNSTERTGENLKGDESKIEEQETNSITGMVEQFEKGDVSLKQEQNGDKIIPFLESASTNTQISLLGVKSLQEHSLSFQHLRGDKLNSPPSFERKGEREWNWNHFGELFVIERIDFFTEKRRQLVLSLKPKTRHKYLVRHSPSIHSSPYLKIQQESEGISWNGSQKKLVSTTPTTKVRAKDVV